MVKTNTYNQEDSIFLKYKVVYLKLQRYLLICINIEQNGRKREELKRTMKEVGETYLKVKEKYTEKNKFQEPKGQEKIVEQYLDHKEQIWDDIPKGVF